MKDTNRRSFLQGAAMVIGGLFAIPKISAVGTTNGVKTTAFSPKKGQMSYLYGGGDGDYYADKDGIVREHKP